MLQFIGGFCSVRFVSPSNLTTSLHVIPSHPTPPCLSVSHLPHLASCHIIIPHLTQPHRGPYFTLPYLTLLYPLSPCCNSPHCTSPHLIVVVCTSHSISAHLAVDLTSLSPAVPRRISSHLTVPHLIVSLLAELCSVAHCTSQPTLSCCSSPHTLPYLTSSHFTSLFCASPDLSHLFSP